MKRFNLAPVAAVLVAYTAATASGSENGRPRQDRFLGSWAFALPDGNPAWLRLQRHEDALKGELLWSVGSARPITEIVVTGNQLSFSRKIRWRPFGDSAVKEITEPFVATVSESKLQLTVRQTSVDEPAASAEVFVLSGKKMPPLPKRPDLSRVVFGPPVRLLNGKDLSGWRLSNPRKKNGWRVEDGVLINETPKTDFGAYGSYGNLRTDREFDDFQLTIEYNVSAGGNSGVYLRGMYEAQVVDRDSKMQGIGGPGAIYGRIAPVRNAARAGGEWNRYVLTLVDRHITVELNGDTVIDNQPIVGCTGGGLSADDTQPGPIFLQGDHTSVKYRNISLRPVVQSS